MTNYKLTIRNNKLQMTTETTVSYDSFSEVKEMVKNAWTDATIMSAIEIDLLTNKRTQLI